jgi:E3 ubiquitin-protein ligase UBR7
MADKREQTAAWNKPVFPQRKVNGSKLARAWVATRVSGVNPPPPARSAPTRPLTPPQRWYTVTSTLIPERPYILRPRTVELAHMADAATSPSTRFVPISTHHLSSEPASSETTLRALLDRSEQLAEEAREALPYSFDECTYNKGYLRQSVWSCIDCGEKGVCYGCSISCHAGTSTNPATC